MGIPDGRAVPRATVEAERPRVGTDAPLVDDEVRVEAAELSVVLDAVRELTTRPRAAVVVAPRAAPPPLAVPLVDVDTVRPRPRAPAGAARRASS